jgi:magnesium transporter
MSFLSATVLETFQTALAAVVSLTFFVPMLLGTGGNAGTQTSITIIRGLATGDVTLDNVWRILKTEVLASLIMAFLLGLIAFFRAFLVGEGMLLAFVVGISMGVLLLLAIATGITLPLISKMVGLDPAVLAGPIMTTIVDVSGLIIYFKIAQLILPQLQVLH